MQCLRRRIDFRRCLAFLLPPLLLMLYQLLFSEYTSLYPDARLYLSIAADSLHTGHFIQTDRAGVEIVVPFAYPLYITLLRAVGMPLVGFAVLNLLSVGASSVFLDDTERLSLRQRRLFVHGVYGHFAPRRAPAVESLCRILLSFHALLAAMACVPRGAAAEKAASSHEHRRLSRVRRRARCWRRSMLRSCCTRCGCA